MASQQPLNYNNKLNITEGRHHQSSALPKTCRESKSPIFKITGDLIIELKII